METKNKIQELGPWFHNIHLPNGLQTVPDHFLGDFPTFKWDRIKKAIPSDLTDRKILDVGCNAGFYSLELAKKGAKVTAIDLDSHYLEQGRWAAAQWGLEDRITFRQQQVYDLAHLEESYDLIWFMGIFYHLRYPMLALDILSQMGDLMVFQTLSLPGSTSMEVLEDVQFHKREVLQHSGWPSMAFIEHKLAGDPTNWWVANHQGIVSMLRSCGFRVTATPEDETYIAERDPDIITALDTWNRSEYLSAIGREWQREVLKKTHK